MGYIRVLVGMLAHGRVMAGVIEVRDFVIWARHIHGDPQLRDEILGLPAGTIVKLKIAGEAGLWVKMEDGARGAPTPGIKPIGPTKSRWQVLYRDRRGDLAEIERG
jgi:hypothetical protein